MPHEDEHSGRAKKRESAIAHLLKALGPGLITGAADDDPSGIATYSQTGAQFGYGMLWTALYQIPLLLAVQEACARIGAVTGKGLARVIKDHYSRSILIGVVLLVLVANTINIGADLGAVAASAQLIVPIPFWVLAVGAAILIAALEVLVSYRQYSEVLKWLALALISYPITALIIAEPWKQILVATVVPHIELSFAFIFIITGVFGTSISPYMFFWQASDEVEQEKLLGVAKQKGGMPHLPGRYIRDVRIDTAVGMIASEIVQWFIIITTATVLFSHGITNIATAADAAKAIEPLVSSFPHAGLVAKLIFAIGVVGLGFLGIPVLAGSSAYAMSEAFGWKEGLSKTFTQARAFYGVIIISTLIGLFMNFIGVNPIKFLVFTAVFNGIAAVPLLFLIAKINTNKHILGAHKGGPISQTLLWVTFAVMGLSCLALLITVVLPH